MKIVDIARRGNVVRFYLGEKTKDWGWTDKDYKNSDGSTPDWLEPCDRFYGDDWDDAPFEHNAGSVYPWFIKGTKDVAFPFDTMILEPNYGDLNSSYCMDDFVDRKAPRLLIISKDAQDALYDDGKGHSAWAYDDNFPLAKEFISNWESENSKKLDGVEEIYLGDEF